MGALNDRIYVMREAIVKITQILAGQSIKVTQRGITAYVKADPSGKPVQVNLPYIPDNATDELIDAIQGFLDHEVAHILFTDWTVVRKAHRTPLQGLHNCLEDIYIERKMSERFEGSAENLKATGRFFLANVTVPNMEQAVFDGDNNKLEAYLSMPLLRAMAGQYVFKDFMSDKMHIAQPMFDKIKHLAPEIANLRSSAHCLEVADKLYKAMNEKEELLPPPPPGAPGEEEDPTPPPPAPAPGDDDDEEQEQEDPTPGEEEEPTPGDPTPGEEDEEEKAPKAAGSAGDDPAGEEDELSVADEKEKEEGVTHRHDPSAPKSGGEADPTAENDLAWTEIDKELMRDYDDSLSTAISDSAAEAAKTTDYLIYTKELDVIEPLHVGTKYTDDMFKRMADTVEPLVGPLQKDLERAISARSLQQWHPGHKSGRLNAGALSRLATGDARVFRRKTEVTSKDVAVELVVDMSGSMSGSKIVTATQTAYALAAVLERIGIPCEVICFTTGRASFTSVADYQNEVRKLGRAFSRNESIYMPILKSFDERLTGDVKKRFGWLPNAGDLRSNIDGESVEIAGRRLMARREKGKIMMVLSDGAPAGSGDWNELYNHLKSTVKALTKAGLNIVGIGIESDDVRQFYPKAIVLNSVTELPKAVLKELRELILK